MSQEEPFIEQIDKNPSKNQDAWYTIKEPLNKEEQKLFEKLFEKLITLMSSIEGNETNSTNEKCGYETLIWGKY